MEKCGSTHNPQAVEHVTTVLVPTTTVSVWQEHYAPRSLALLQTLPLVYVVHTAAELHALRPSDFTVMQIRHQHVVEVQLA